jgi:hypothetical protein
MPATVGYGGDLKYADTDFVQLAGYKRRIGVDNLPDQQFITNGNDFYFHQ